MYTVLYNIALSYCVTQKCDSFSKYVDMKYWTVQCSKPVLYAVAGVVL